MRDWPPKPVPKWKQAVFLDRDGTINVDTHYPYEPAKLQLLPHATEGLGLLTALPITIIVVANQAGIALGKFTHGQMSEFNRELRSQIRRGGGRIDAMYYCPDKEPKDLPLGEQPSECSKPAPGMLLEACRDFRLDLSKCFIIGDKTSDIEAGRRVGCKTILVMTGKAGKEEGALAVEPDHTADDIYHAALIIRSFLLEENGE